MGAKYMILLSFIFSLWIRCTNEFLNDSSYKIQERNQYKKVLDFFFPQNNTFPELWHSFYTTPQATSPLFPRMTNIHFFLKYHCLNKCSWETREWATSKMFLDCKMCLITEYNRRPCSKIEMQFSLRWLTFKSSINLKCWTAPGLHFFFSFVPSIDFLSLYLTFVFRTLWTIVRRWVCLQTQAILVDSILK